MTKEEILELEWWRAITVSRGEHKRGKLHIKQDRKFVAMCNSSVHLSLVKYPRSMVEKAYDNDRICKHCLKLLEQLQ
jgi:hypothetical protein